MFTHILYNSGIGSLLRYQHGRSCRSASSAIQALVTLYWDPHTSGGMRAFCSGTHTLPVSMHGLQATVPHGRFIVSRSCPASTRSLKSTISNRLEIQERSMHLRRSHKDVEVVPSQSSLPTDHASPHTMLEASASIDGVTESSKSGHALISRKGSRDTAPPLPWWKLSGMRVMGLEPSPELLAISMVYFVQGILGLSRLALQFFFKVRARAKAPPKPPVPTSLMRQWMVPAHNPVGLPWPLPSSLRTTCINGGCQRIIPYCPCSLPSPPSRTTCMWSPQRWPC